MTDPIAQQIADLTAEHRDFAGEVNGHLSTVTQEQGRIRGEHVSQARWISETGPVLDDHTQLLAEHGERLVQDTAVLEGLREDLNVVLAELPRQPKHPPVCWVGMAAEDAEQIWPLLGEWVDQVLVGRYFVTRAQLPDCWALHPGAVEELTWLRTCWLNAFLRTAGAVPAAEWHTRWRMASLDGVTAAVEREADAVAADRCGPGLHLGVVLPGAVLTTPAAPVGAYRPPVAVPVAVAPTPSSTGSSPKPWDAPPLTHSGSAGAPIGSEPVDSRDFDSKREAKEDLAVRRFWWPHLERAAEVDVAARRQAEAQAAQAAAEVEDPPDGD
ncbi:MAG: hypothetical protein ABIQ18_28245 [Umezawaea sp.]